MENKSHHDQVFASPVFSIFKQKKKKWLTNQIFGYIMNKEA